MTGAGPVTEALADDNSGRRRAALDAVAVAITRLGDLADYTPGEVAQLHYMAVELVAATSRVLAERERADGG